MRTNPSMGRFNSASTRARTADSLEDGLYRVLSLPPGPYRIQVKKPGFADEVKEGLTLAAGQILRVDFSLRVSAQSEQVTVVSQANQVDTEQGNISGKIELTELKETPLNG